MPRKSTTGITNDMLTNFVNQFIESELEFGQGYTITRYLIARAIREWWKENQTHTMPYNTTAKLYEILENRHKCIIVGNNTFGGTISAQVQGCQAKNIIDATSQSLNQTNFCIYCHRVNTKLTGSTFENGMECKDIDNCVDYSQEKIRSGEQLPKPPEVTRFPGNFNRLPNEEKIKLLQNREIECNDIIEWLKVTEIPDKDKQLKFIRIKRSANRKQIKQIEIYMRNDTEELKAHRAQWNRMTPNQVVKIAKE